MNEIVNLYSFTFCGEIFLNHNQMPRFEIVNNIGPGVVYVWMQCNTDAAPDSYYPLYVGTTDLFLADRCETHKGGFGSHANESSGSPTGRAHRERIRNVLNNNNRILVFAQEAGTSTVFNQQVSMRYPKEEAMLNICLQFNPWLWNS